MNNQEIIDLRPGELIARIKRNRVQVIWQVEEMVENSNNVIHARMPGVGRHTWIWLKWSDLKSFRRIA